MPEDPGCRDRVPAPLWEVLVRGPSPERLHSPAIPGRGCRRATPPLRLTRRQRARRLLWMAVHSKAGGSLSPVSDRTSHALPGLWMAVHGVVVCRSRASRRVLQNRKCNTLLHFPKCNAVQRGWATKCRSHAHLTRRTCPPSSSRQRTAVRIGAVAGAGAHMARAHSRHEARTWRRLATGAGSGAGSLQTRARARPALALPTPHRIFILRCSLCCARR